MKIGILTFHSQLNYGGVLQCWALQTALEKMGHEVVVIDRWLDENNCFLTRNYPKNFWQLRKKIIFRSLLGLGDSRFFTRVKRTRRFLAEKLHLTSFHFYEWKDAPLDLGVDIVVVGSDQVWNLNWSHSWFYLMDEVPKSLSRMSYAASIGMPELPEEYVSIFKSALSNFVAISCREKEACEICTKLGFKVTHVLDPTLLIDTNDWLKLLHFSSKECMHPTKKKMVCYFLEVDVDKTLPLLEGFAIKNNCDVSILVFDAQRRQDLLPIPISLNKIISYGKSIFKRLTSRIQICEGAGPIEFVKEHATATWIITDSFHSLMFSIIFNKNCRVIRPNSSDRMKMFSRIEEMANHTQGNLITESLQSALISIANDENILYDKNWIKNKKKESVNFLEKNLTI